MTETSLLGFTTIAPSVAQDRSAPALRHNWRRWGMIAIAASLIPACVNTKFQTNMAPRAYVVADDPYAAAAGRDVLARGGTAADAAAAMGLAMAVTLPSRAGLAGGGVCVVYNGGTKETRTLDFLPRPVGTNGAALPGTLRAFYALQAAGGVLRWEQVVVGAEALARQPTPVSRTFAQDLQAGAARLGNGEVRRAFAPDGRPVAAGTPVAQPELAATLSAVRRSGFAALHNGAGAEALAAAVGVDATSVRAVVPRWGATQNVDLGQGATLHFADLPESGGTLARVWTAASDAAPAERTARARSLLTAGGGAGEAPAAGFAVLDAGEQAVACSLTMGGLFGTGRSVPGAGILTAAGVRSAGFGTPAVVSTMLNRSLWAGAGSAIGGDGPAAGPAALFDVGLPALEMKRFPVEIQAARPAGAPGRAAVVGCLVSADNGVRACQPAPDSHNGGAGFDVEVTP